MGREDTECRVTVVGERGVGKAALVARFVGDQFLLDLGEEVGKGTQRKTCSVSGKKVSFVISSCGHLADLTPGSPLLAADVFLLCFSVSDHASLYSALDHWLPLLSDLAPGTPAVLAGCKTDLRTSGRLQRLVSAEHALALSRQAGTAMYLETSALGPDSRSTAAAFEVACLAARGECPRPPAAPREAALPPVHRPVRREASEPRHPVHRFNCLAGEPYQPLAGGQLLTSSRSGSISSVSLHSKTSTLSSTTSSGSGSSPGPPSNPVLRVSTGRTPSLGRRARRGPAAGAKEETVTIKVQRLTAERTYEEIDIELPAGVYNNIQTPGDLSQCSRNSRERRSLGSRLRSLILKS